MLWVYITSPTLWHSYDSAIPSGYAALRIYIQVPFPYQVIPSQRQQLATALSSMGVPLAYIMYGYPFRRHLISGTNFLVACHMSIYLAAVDDDELC